jgi:hypothetical protein
MAEVPIKITNTPEPKKGSGNQAWDEEMKKRLKDLQAQGKGS